MVFLCFQEAPSNPSSEPVTVFDEFKEQVSAANSMMPWLTLLQTFLLYLIKMNELLLSINVGFGGNFLIIVIYS